MELLLVAVACLVMVAVHIRLTRNLDADHRAREQRLEDDVLARKVALDKQAKVFVKRLAQSNSAANKMIDECRKSQDEARHLREDTKALQQKINAALSDPRVKRLLNKAGE